MRPRKNEIRRVIIEVIALIMLVIASVIVFNVGYSVGFVDGVAYANKLCTIPRPSMGKAMVVVFYRLNNDTQEVGSIRFLLIGGENVTLDLRGVVFVKIYLFAQMDTHYIVDVYFGKKIYSVSGMLSAGNFTALYRFLNGCSTIYTPSGLVDLGGEADKVVVSIPTINSTVAILLR